jgi:hypothetical protein
LIERAADWRATLAAFIDERRADPFVWGARDCCLFAADAVAGFTGLDVAAPLRGYATRFGALRALRRAGFERVFDVVDPHFPTAARARAGDVVGLPAWPLDALMIAHDAQSAWGQEAHGLVRLAIPADAIIWSV